MFIMFRFGVFRRKKEKIDEIQNNIGTLAQLV